MTYTLTKIEEGNSLPYIGIVFKSGDEYISKYMEVLRKYFYLRGAGTIGEEWIAKQQKRDQYSWHITVFTPMECKKDSRLFNAVGKTIEDLETLGIGTISSGDLETFYIIVDSMQLQLIRNIYSYKGKDLHITLAFSEKDLFNKIKDENTLIATETAILI